MEWAVTQNYLQAHESALKVAFLAIQQASKKWTMPIQNWKPALNRFIIEFGDRLNGHL
ncbi:transposase [Aeromonas salmonicida subsp. smithia]|nr:transposase [Aeromonas salmonicida subsp. smithia]